MEKNEANNHLGFTGYLPKTSSGWESFSDEKWRHNKSWWCRKRTNRILEKAPSLGKLPFLFLWQRIAWVSFKWKKNALRREVWMGSTNGKSLGDRTHSEKNWKKEKEICYFISVNSFLIVVGTGCFNGFDFYKSFTSFLAYFHLGSGPIFSNTITIGINNTRSGEYNDRP